ncbi:hypothetical protein E2C01_065193 [Portunus trituberculatus]|uniref:Uncharacterized protein n=1 Tax=Portunus trituberculatus TaxID=210409 RepID=A0A5B7HMC4_PORTR|nr:hypothetical protein [Portunus trituberculatus]
MTFCWTTAPQERPTVDELTTYLTNFQQHLDRYDHEAAGPRALLSELQDDTWLPDMKRHTYEKVTAFQSLRYATDECKIP